jgi:tellurite resistance protein
VSAMQGESMPRAQVIALVECMLSTAHVDGLQPKELALIRSFYDEQRKPDMPIFDAVTAAAGKDLGLLSQVRGDAAFAEQLLLMCLMTGYADGRLSEAERSHVLGLAQQLGVAAARVGELHVQVKDSLIASLAHLPEPESVAALAKTL